MFDAQCDLAALVYDDHEDPDAVLRDFAAKLNAHGFRAVGMVQAGQCADSSLSAVLVHNGEKILLAQDFDPCASGCRLDLARLQDAGGRVADALEAGADLLIVNRFGKRERDGKGLAYLIERALEQEHSGGDRGPWPAFRRLDQVRRRHERQTALRPRHARGVVARRIRQRRERHRASSGNGLRNRQVVTFPPSASFEIPPLAIAVPDAQESDGVC